MVTPLDVPRLVAGDRFVLRPWELGDLALVREASGDEHIPLISTVPSAYSQEAGEAFVRRQWERASTGSGYPFVIVRVEDGQPLGTVGVWLKDLNEGRASLGYWVVGSARGQGVAAEALRAVTAWALVDLQVPRLQLYVEPWNVASRRTAESGAFLNSKNMGEFTNEDAEAALNEQEPIANAFNEASAQYNSIESTAAADPPVGDEVVSDVAGFLEDASEEGDGLLGDS